MYKLHNTLLSPSLHNTNMSNNNDSNNNNNNNNVNGSLNTNDTSTNSNKQQQRRRNTNKPKKEALKFKGGSKIMKELQKTLFFAAYNEILLLSNDNDDGIKITEKEQQIMFGEKILGNNNNNNNNNDSITLTEQMVLGMNQFRYLYENEVNNDDSNEQVKKKLRDCYFPQIMSGGKISIYTNMINGINYELLCAKSVKNPVDLTVRSMLRGAKEVLRNGQRAFECAIHDTSEYKYGIIPSNRTIDDYRLYIRQCMFMKLKGRTDIYDDGKDDDNDDRDDDNDVNDDSIMTGTNTTTNPIITNDNKKNDLYYYSDPNNMPDDYYFTGMIAFFLWGFITDDNVDPKHKSHLFQMKDSIPITKTTTTTTATAPTTTAATAAAAPTTAAATTTAATTTAATATTAEAITATTTTVATTAPTTTAAPTAASTTVTTTRMNQASALGGTSIGNDDRQQIRNENTITTSNKRKDIDVEDISFQLSNNNESSSISFEQYMEYYKMQMNFYFDELKCLQSKFSLDIQLIQVYIDHYFKLIDLYKNNNIMDRNNYDHYIIKIEQLLKQKDDIHIQFDTKYNNCMKQHEMDMKIIKETFLFPNKKNCIRTQQQRPSSMEN